MSRIRETVSETSQPKGSLSFKKKSDNFSQAQTSFLRTNSSDYNDQKQKKFLGKTIMDSMKREKVDETKFLNDSRKRYLESVI